MAFVAVAWFARRLCHPDRANPLDRQRIDAVYEVYRSRRRQDMVTRPSDLIVIAGANDPSPRVEPLGRQRLVVLDV